MKSRAKTGTNWKKRPRKVQSAFLHLRFLCLCRSCNNNSNHDNVHGAIIMTKVNARVHSVHLID